MVLNHIIAESLAVPKIAKRSTQGQSYSYTKSKPSSALLLLLEVGRQPETQ